MIKTKKRLLPIFIFVFVLSVLCSAHCLRVGVSAYADSAEPKQVSLVEWQHYNAYSTDSRREDSVESKWGVLLRFNDVLSDNRSEINGGIKTLNLVNEYGKYVFINDMPLDFYTGAEISYFLEEYIWVYIPNLAIYRTISVEEPFGFKDRTVMPFTLYSYINTNGFTDWSDSYDKDNQKTNAAAFKSIAWNNKGYRYFNPKDGLLIEYDKNLSNIQSEFDGGLMRTNLVRLTDSRNEFLGNDSIGARVLLDGTPLKDIKGAEITYHSERYLWLYAPNMTDYAKLEIMGDTLFLDAILSEKTFYSNGNEWLEDDPNAPREEKTSVSFEGLEWNNSDFGNRDGKNGILLKYSGNLSQFASEIGGGVSKVNKVKTSIGEHIKLGGTPLKDIDGAEIAYQNEKFLWVYVPADMLSLSGGYTCLTVDADTEFLNAVLPGVTLYFDGSYWEESEPETESYEKNELSGIMYNDLSVEGKEGYVYTVLAFESDFAAAANSRPNFAQTGDAGEKIKVNGKTLRELYQTDGNTYCSWGEKYGKNALYLELRIADLFPSGVTTPVLTVENGTKFMNKSIGEITLYLVNGEWSENSGASATPGTDNDAPYIYYYGEDNYFVIAGENVIDFSSKAYAFDEREGEVDCTVIIPDGAKTGGKWNRGEWTIELIAKDTENNTRKKQISVKAIGEEEQFLSVYVNGIFSYRVRYGEKIGKDKSEELAKGDPQKADGATSFYVFAGWTFKDKPWDFENDVVAEDVWLSPTYKEYRRVFTLTVEDEKTGKTEVSTVRYGDVIDFSKYVSGESTFAEIDGIAVKRVNVVGDVYAKLQYEAASEDNGLTKAIIILAVCWLVSALLAVSGVLLYKKNGKKAVKDNERFI